MTNTPMFKTTRSVPAPRSLVVYDFKHLDFDIVSNFGFRILAQELDSLVQFSPYEDG